MNKKHGLLLKRVAGQYLRYRSYSFEKKVVKWRLDQPVVSFTFDDFPRSAFKVGGMILGKYDVRGSFYASFGLRGTYREEGEMFSLEDLAAIVHAGHEVGCHTYDHLDAWKTRADIFEESIRKNLDFLKNLFPGKPMRTLSYPMNEPHPKIKAIAAKYFTACRGGGQINNTRTLDLNLIRSCFINHRNYGDIDLLVDLIKKNAKEKCWLVFSTHDIGDVVSPSGCPKDVFEEIVARSVESKSLVLPILDVCSLIVK